MTTINNALSGALAAQVALNTVSNNIANVMTPGFTRQGALFSAVAPGRMGVAVPGNGVAVSSLQRFSDGYKNLQMWQAASELGQRDTPQPYFTQLEQVLGDDASSLNHGLDMFFSALNAASVDPTSSPLRQQVITASEALAQRFNSVNQVLVNQRVAVADQRGSTVSQINSLTRDIAGLNSQVSATVASGVNASALVDARDLKIDQLASLVGLQVVDQPDGTRSVSLRSGVPLVAGGVAATLSVQTNANGTHTFQVDFARESFNLGSQPLSGQLGALEDYEAQTLVPMLDVMQNVAQQLTTKVNAQLAAGFDLNGQPGSALFQIATAGGGLLKVSPGMAGADLAFSSDPAAPGNSDNLLALVDIKNQTISAGVLGSVRLGDVHTQMVGRLAIQSQQNRMSLNTAQTVRNQAEESWKATSGVNTDEEAMNLVQYQQMYQANMKVIAVANQLFDSTLASFG